MFRSDIADANHQEGRKTTEYFTYIKHSKGYVIFIRIG